MSELRLALRRLWKAPGTALTALLTVALAIGANGMIFSAVRALIIRPLPFHEAERIVWIYGASRSAPDAREKLGGEEAQGLARETATYESVAVIGDRAFLRVNGERRERWNGIWVTPSLTTVLGITPALGRTISLDDARTGAPVMMISHERWMRDLGGDPALIGRPISFYDGHTFTLIGVLPPGLEFPLGRMPQSGNGSGFRVGVQDFWILGQEGDELPGGTVVARLREGVPPDVAESRSKTLSARLITDGVIAEADRTLHLVSLRDQVLGLVGPGLQLAQGFAVLMLLLACANLANLTLLRTHARAQEFAVQAALGASSRTIAGGIIAEVAILCAAGGLFGLALTGLGQRALQFLAAGSLPMIANTTVDWVVVLVTIAATAFVALVVAIIPAIVVSKGNLHLTLLGGSRTQTASRHQARTRVALVIVQVALALMLSVGAGLIATSFSRLMSVDAGYDPRGVITADVEIFDHPKPAEFYRELNRRLRAVPGVEAMGLIHSTPLTGKWTFADPFVIVGRSEDPAKAPLVAGAFVGFDYFAAMETPVIRGRAFTEAEDMAGNARVIVINESAARRFFPAGDALGESVILAGTPHRIVGIVKDTRDVALEVAGEPRWYQPLLFSGTQLIVRVRGDAGDAVERIRRELLASDPRFVVNGIGTLDDVIGSTVIERRMAMRMLSALAALALVMASIGLYGVVSFNVLRRQREFGVRSALGAQRSALLAMVLRDGVGMALAGVAVGVVLAAWLGGVLQRLLFEVSPTEPVTIVSISALLLIVTVLATLIPGWRAASVDPVSALRAD